MEKKALRQFGLTALDWLYAHPEIKREKEAQILAAFFAHSLWKEAQTIGVIRALAIELDTTPIFQQAWLEGKQVVVPKVMDKALQFGVVTPQTLFKTSPFGIEEPVSAQWLDAAAIDLLIVPGLIFTLSGFRIGFGGGFYDRLLATYAGRTCSLVFSEQVQEHWVQERFDQRIETLFIR